MPEMEGGQPGGLPEMEGDSNGLKAFVGGKWRAEAHGTSDPVEAGVLEPVEVESRSVRVITGAPVELDATK